MCIKIIKEEEEIFNELLSNDKNKMYCIEVAHHPAKNSIADPIKHNQT